MVVVAHGCPLGAVCCPYQAACSSCRSVTMNERGDSVVNCGNHPNSLRQRGGVMFLTRSNIPAIRRHDLDSNCELFWVELILPAMKILGVLYCPPSSPSSQFSLRIAVICRENMYYLLYDPFLYQTNYFIVRWCQIIFCLTLYLLKINTDNIHNC